MFGFLCVAAALSAAERPNIVWIVGEDMGCELGCYGDKLAHTPNLDKLAAQGVRYRHCYTHCPVCAPSRSGLITGQYPITIGTHHMRSTLLKPPQTFTSMLRQSGYYVAWPGKTDFNFAVPADAFDSTKPWLNNVPKQPFFAYVNFTVSHESQIRATKEQHAKNTNRLTATQRQDAAKFALPPYYPDTPEVRLDFKQYYELCTAVDYLVGDVLAALERAGVANNTVVIFFGDHGRGMPRSKRWCYEQGTHVPLIVRWPGKISAGSTSDELVSFVDLPRTAVSLAGARATKEMQGQVFLGSEKATPRKYVYHHRDRMDETFDRIRAVRDSQYRYVRNYHPELPYAQRVQYMELMPTMQVWRRLNAEGKLNDAQKLFFAPTKPKEELYDVTADPHEIRNLAPMPAHQQKLIELRKAMDEWLKDSKDLGDIPEKKLIESGLVADRLKEYEKRKPE
jgi:uncharacterized sulfatase